MRIKLKDFELSRRKRVALAAWPTQIDPIYRSEKNYEELLRRQVDALSEQQRLLYASNRNALLIVFQAMDAAGKDGVIAHVMSGVNPQGCQVHSFSHPSQDELKHDFLWRTTVALPERGRIGIFNRSYYEEVLIVRVHPQILQAETGNRGVALWHERHRSIRALERHLSKNDTRIIKFFLHLSKEEQRRRFVARIDNPAKHWKFDSGDVEERKYWHDYQRAYEHCLGATASSHAPWYIVPADDKKNARLIVSHIIVQQMRALKLSYPKTRAARQRQLRGLRKALQ